MMFSANYRRPDNRFKPSLLDKRLAPADSAGFQGGKFMSKLFLSLLFGGAVAMTAFNAEAFPQAPLSPAPISSDVIQVAGGCGPGWHRGPRGGCRRNFAPAPRCFWRGTPRGPVRVCR